MLGIFVSSKLREPSRPTSPAPKLGHFVNVSGSATLPGHRPLDLAGLWRQATRAFPDLRRVGRKFPQWEGEPRSLEPAQATLVPGAALPSECLCGSSFLGEDGSAPLWDRSSHRHRASESRARNSTTNQPRPPSCPSSRPTAAPQPGESAAGSPASRGRNRGDTLLRPPLQKTSALNQCLLRAFFLFPFLPPHPHPANQALPRAHGPTKSG